MHHLQTCKLPLAAVMAYYRRNLSVQPEESRLRLRRSRTEWIGVKDLSEQDDGSEAVEILVVEFAAHTVYLQPSTGTGLLLMPPRWTDIDTEDAFAGISWPNDWGGLPGVGLSLHTADLTHALKHLATSGWTLLEDVSGDVEIAGKTVDGRSALCMYAVRTTHEQLVLEDLHHALAALHTVADLRHGPTPRI